MRKVSSAVSAAVPLEQRQQRKPLHIPLAALPWLFMAGDAVVILVAAVVAETGYHRLFANHAGDLQRSLGLAAVAAVLFMTLQHLQHLYRGMRHVRLLSQAWRALTSWLTVFSALAGLLFLLKLGDTFSRAAFITFFFAGYAGLLTWRVVVRRLCVRLALAGSVAGPRVALLVEHGSPDVAAQLSRLRRCGYHITRLFVLPATNDPASNDSAGRDTQIALALRGLVRHVREQDVNEILVLASWGCIAGGDDIRSALRMVPVPVKLIADQRLSRVLSHPTCEVGTSQAIMLKPSALSPLQRLGKRCFDVVAASVMLVGLSPVLLLAALAIRLDTPGPVIFRQWRGGFNGKRFRIAKFRTMRVLEDGHAVSQATRGDARVTRVGRWLRATSIDELPQLLNVISGDMSLVGPRPHAIVHDVTYSALIEPYPARQNVKPGITGWAQVNGCRGETADTAQMKRRIDHDLTYVENWSFAMDIAIIAMTVREVLRPRNAY